MGSSRAVGQSSNRLQTRRLAVIILVVWLVTAGLGVAALSNVQQLTHEVAERPSFPQRVAATRLLHIVALETEDAFESCLDSGDAGDLALAV